MTALLFSVAMLSPGGAHAAQTPQAPPKDPIAWRRDFRAAQKESQEKNRPLLLVAAFPTCTWWIRMERTTMRDPRVRALVARTIPVQINGEVDEELSQRLKISQCPLTVLYAPDGKVLFRVEGLQQAEPFLRLLHKGIGEP